MSDDPKFWKGPYGVLVPNNIHCVVDEDGGNTRGKEGDCTEMNFSWLNMNEAKYKELYAEFNQNDGQWYYKKPEKKNMRFA